MAAVTAEKLTDIQIVIPGNTHKIPVKSGATIYGGTFAIVDSTGYLDNLTSTNYVQGRVVAFVNDKTANESGPAATTSAGSISGTLEQASADAGDKTVRDCYIDNTIVEVTFSSIAQSDLFKTVYLQNNYTGDETQVAGIAIGSLVKYISATKGYVALNRFYGKDGYVCTRGAITAATTTTGGDAISIANPFGETAMIKNVIIDVTTQATGAATMDIGVAADGTTSSDTLIDGVDVGSAAIVASALGDGGTNGGPCRKWTTTQYITGTPSATLAGLVGTYEIEAKIWE